MRSAFLSSPTPTTVLVFENHTSYDPLKPLYQGKTRSNIAEFFQPGQGINYITLTIEGGLDNLGVIYHEYVHLLINNNVSGKSARPVAREDGGIPAPGARFAIVRPSFARSRTAR